MNEDVLTVLRTVAGLRSAVEGGWLEEIRGAENRWLCYQLTDTGRAVLADHFANVGKMVSNADQQSDAELAAEWEQAQRAAFEEWLSGWPGGYINLDVQLAWEAWREAARRAGR